MFPSLPKLAYWLPVPVENQIASESPRLHAPFDDRAQGFFQGNHAPDADLGILGVEPQRPGLAVKCLLGQAPNLSGSHSGPEEPLHKVGNVLVPDIGEDRKKSPCWQRILGGHCPRATLESQAWSLAACVLLTYLARRYHYPSECWRPWWPPGSYASGEGRREQQWNETRSPVAVYQLRVAPVDSRGVTAGCIDSALGERV